MEPTYRPRNTTDDPVTPLQVAARSGQFAAVKRLIKLGACTLPSDEDTALLLDVFNGHLEVVYHLSSNGAASDVERVPRVAGTCSGKLEVVNLLLHSVANTTATTLMGWVSVISAAENPQVYVPKKLLSIGAVDTNKTSTARRLLRMPP